MTHPVFTLKNPNRVRALIGAFAVGNPLRFHDRSGGGYRLLREVVQALDSINPQTAARMAAAFETWRRYDPERQRMIRSELEAIAAGPGLSNNLYEMVSKMLGEFPCTRAPRPVQLRCTGGIRQNRAKRAGRLLRKCGRAAPSLKGRGNFAGRRPEAVGAVGFAVRWSRRQKTANAVIAPRIIGDDDFITE